MYLEFGCLRRLYLSFSYLEMVIVILNVLIITEVKSWVFVSSFVLKTIQITTKCYSAVVVKFRRKDFLGDARYLQVRLCYLYQQ